MTKTFLLGLGAQKAGTTWLHDYLSSLDGVDMGFLKEYHVFDSRHQSDDRGRKAELIAKAQRALGRKDVDFASKPRLWTFVAMLADQQNYFNYFAGLLSQPDVFVTGDITPSYSMLGAEDLSAIRDDFERRGVTCKAVFLMRDPVERLWSAARMRRRERPDAPQVSEDQMVLQALKKGGFAGRTRFEDTLAAMEAVLAPDDCLIGFYETLFQDSEIQRICAFLGLEFRAPEFDKRVNVSQKTSPLSEDTCRKVAEHFAPTYRAVAERFGPDTIRDLWPNAQFVV
ncbi:MAG: sulfotransferase [Roseinatronobacter sp.]